MFKLGMLTTLCFQRNHQSGILHSVLQTSAISMRFAKKSTGSGVQKADLTLALLYSMGKPLSFSFPIINDNNVQCPALCFSVTNSR